MPTVIQKDMQWSDFSASILVDVAIFQYTEKWSLEHVFVFLMNDPLVFYIIKEYFVRYQSAMILNANKITLILWNMLARYSLCLPTVWMAICCLCNWNGPWNKPIYAIVDSPERIGHCVDVTYLVFITFCGQITVQELACLLFTSYTPSKTEQ